MFTLYNEIFHNLYMFTIHIIFTNCCTLCMNQILIVIALNSCIFLIVRLTAALFFIMRINVVLTLLNDWRFVFNINCSAIHYIVLS